MFTNISSYHSYKNKTTKRKRKSKKVEEKTEEKIEEVLEEITQMWDAEFGDEDGWVYAKNMIAYEKDADYKENICNYNGIPESMWNKMLITGKTITIEQMDINDFMLSATDDEGNPYITYEDSKILSSLIDLYDEGYESIIKYVDSLYAGTLSDVLVENVLSSIENDECAYKTMSQLIANEYMKLLKTSAETLHMNECCNLYISF